MEEAEGQRIENEVARFRQNLKEMKFYLLLAKSRAFGGETDEDVLMFSKTADAWLFALTEMESSNPA